MSALDLSYVPVGNVDANAVAGNVFATHAAVGAGALYQMLSVL